MNRLYQANLIRLWKSKLMGLGMLALAGFAVLLCADKYRFYNEEMVLDGIFFGYVYVAGIPVAILAGLFLGTEYGDGTMRNKLIAGYKRSTVYLAGFTAVFTASLLMSLVYIAVVCALGIPFLGWLVSDWQIILVMLLESVLTLGAASAVFTMIGMLWQNKAVSAVLCVLVGFCLHFLTISVKSSLEQPEFYEGYGFVHSEDGAPQMVSLEGQSNPYYVSGTKRVIYEFINDFNPVSQGLQIADMYGDHPKHMGRLPLYSLVIILGVSSGGIAVFNKKDLK